MRGSPFILLALILPVAACGQSSPPAPWVEFYRRGEVVASVDTSRIVRPGQGVVVWLRMDYLTPEEVPGERGKMFNRVDMLDRIDCGAGTVTNMRMRTWDPEGRMLADEAAQTRWNTISEHPLGQSGIYPALCERLSRR
jgi:hypothetical protein